MITLLDLNEKDYLLIIGILVVVIICVILLSVIISAEKRIPSALLKAFNIKPLIFFNKKNEFVGVTNDFISLLPVHSEGTWEKEIDGIVIDEKNYSIEEFIEYLKEKDSVKAVFEINGTIVNLSLQKKQLFDNEKLIGYVFTEKTQETTKEKEILPELVKNVTNSINPFAYIIWDSGKVIANKAMQSLLGSIEPLKVDTIYQKVLQEDKQIFDNIHEEESAINVLSLKTINGYQSFEFTNQIIDNKNITLIMKIQENAKKVYYEQRELETITKKLLDEQEFGAILISMQSMMVLDSNKSFDIVNKYLLKIKQELLEEKDYLIAINDYEYVIYVTDLNRFGEMIQNISQDKSILLKDMISYGDKEYEIINKLGIAYSSDSQKAKELETSLDSALALANSDGYGKNYSIFSPKKKVVEEYSFEKIKVDLDNSFLKEDE